MPSRIAFHGGSLGAWQVLSTAVVRGEALAPVSHIEVQPGAAPPTGFVEPRWTLTGLISNLRYATRRELTDLRQRQEGLGRPAARQAALIPIKKSAAWWGLAQDERRAIFEEQSAHTAIGLNYLPAIARQLYHCRDLGEPFDFITWFEYAPNEAPAFEELVGRLRETAEWAYVEREIDLRLVRL